MKRYQIRKDYLKTLTALYVENDRETRRSFEHLLMPHLGTVISADNGTQALELFQALHPDIVITDIQMPVMDGLTMAQRIREHDESVPIIVVTAFEQTDYLIRSIEIGVERYVVKPVMLDRMLDALLYCADRIYMERQLQHLALHDPLTELPNRTLLEDRLKMACAAADRNDGQLALFFIDLDKFKAINDALGHHAGDQVLQEIGRRLKGMFRSVDTVCRLSGDEFVVVLTGIRDQHDVNSSATKLLEAIHGPIKIDSLGLTITASIGVALYPQDGHDMDSLLRSADRKMYRAKALGGDHFCQKLD